MYLLLCYIVKPHHRPGLAVDNLSSDSWKKEAHDEGIVTLLLHGC